MREYTGVAGVMSSEALLENPSLFLPQKSDSEMSTRELLQRQFGLAREYISLVKSHYPAQCGGAGGHGTVKAHVFKLLYRILDNPKMHDLRNRLGDRRVHRVEQTEQIMKDLEERALNMSDSDISFDTATFSWYRRHRQPRITKGREAVVIDRRKAEIQERLQALKLRRQERIMERNKMTTM